MAADVSCVTVLRAAMAHMAVEAMSGACARTRDGGTSAIVVVWLGTCVFLCEIELLKGNPPCLAAYLASRTASVSIVLVSLWKRSPDHLTKLPLLVQISRASCMLETPLLCAHARCVQD